MLISFLVSFVYMVCQVCSVLGVDFLYFWSSQAAALKGSDHRRATNVSARLDAQQKKLNLPVLPTTTIGSFPQTIELRRVRREYKAKK